MAAAANTTVDPSQVYDFRAERERKAKIEAEKRRKQDEADAARKAEEAHVAEAKRLAEEQQANEAKRRMEEAKRQADEARAAAKAEADRRKDEQRKARESKNAATALASLASSSSAPHMNEAEPPANDEEAEMRAMFQKMREFNSKNPAMLAKLWEEERRAHAGQSQSPQPAQVTQPAASTPKPAVPSKASSSQASAANATASNSTKPAPAEKAKASKASPNMSVARSKAPEVTTNQGSTNLWPPGKKGLLADIAARWLHGVNPQKVVTAFEILQLLDQNPNYVQLCESLEGLGLKFERAAFARELLRGVPPASSANQHTSKGSDATIMSANGTLAQATGAAAVGGTEHTPSLQASSAPGQQQRRPSSLMGWNNQPNGKATSSNNGMVDYEMPSFHNSSAPNQTADGTSFSSQPGRAGPQSAIGNSHSRQPSQSVQPSREPSRRSMSNVQQGAPVPVGSARQTPDVKPMSPPRPPANKEEAARKRGFGELVDLTAEESDEDAPPKKIMQTAQGFGPRPFQPQPPQSQPHLNQQRDSPFAFNTRGAPVVPTGPSPGSTAPPFNPPGVPGIPAVANMGRMSTGSPAMTPTANMRAKDVSGPVSAKPPLPSSTMLPFKRKGPTNEQLQAERIRGRMVVEPIMRDRVARKSTYDSRTIARDVLLATGRHPDMRALNSHLNVMQKMLGDRGGMADGAGNKSDLATIKWDIIDPDPPKKKESSSLVQAQDVAEIQDADDEGDMSSLNHKHRAPGGAATARQSSAALDLRDKPATPDAMPKKRGRPPRSSMPSTHTFVSVNDKMSAAGPQGIGAAGTPRQGSGQPGTPATMPAARAPAASQAPTDGSVGYSAFRHFDENGNPIKKKGRPVGWRKNIHSREAQGLAPAKSASAGVKPKPAVPKQPEKLQEPNYQIYRCKWLGCAAELHSLDVLKKHMIKVHGRPDGEDLFECLWQDCESKTKRVTGPGRTRLDNATFSDIGGWLSHVDKEHLQPVAWRLGDGPRGGLSGKLDGEV